MGKMQGEGSHQAQDNAMLLLEGVEGKQLPQCQEQWGGTPRKA